MNVQDTDSIACSFIEQDSFPSPGLKVTKILENISIGKPPLSNNSKKIKEIKSEKVAYCAIDEMTLIQLKAYCKKIKSSDYLALTTIIFMYLYRLNNYQSYSLNFLDQVYNENQTNSNQCFEQKLPLLIDFNPDISFSSALDKTAFLLSQYKKNELYTKDIFLKYPSFFEDFKSSLVSIMVTTDIEKIQYSDLSSALSIFINPKEMKFCIYSKKNAFPERINGLILNMPHHILTMIKNIINNPNLCLNEISILTGAEYQKIIVDWNDTEKEFPNNDKPIHYFFEEQVLKTPHKIAVIFENKSLTYFELNKKANQVAHHLLKLGVSPNTLIAICAKRSLEMVIGILGILKSGCAYLPLDPTHPIDRLTYLLLDSKVSILLTDKLYSWIKTDLLNNVNAIELGKILTLMSIESDIKLKNRCLSENLAYVIYTSGTTGKPKGVAVTHRSLVNHMLWMIPKFNFTETDVFLQKTPFSFDASIWEFFAPLLCGGKLVIAPNVEPIDFKRLIKKFEITVLQLVPSMLTALLQENEFQFCSSLQQVFAGGEALLPSTVNLFFKMVPAAKLHNLYGPTETTIQVITYSYDSSVELPADTILIGRPINNVQAYVLDQYLNPVPMGVIGELHIGGLCLAKGYLNRQYLTLERFIQNPFSRDNQANKLYKTGDMVRWLPDGNLEYLNRTDDQVKVHGYRIELREIEANLLQHDLIQECAVIAQECVDSNGALTGNKYLVAYYVKRLNLTHLDLENFVGTWETLYQSQYSSLDINDFKENTVGWNSSYTDRPIDQKGLLEHVNATVDRIKQFEPEIILEIGSGSGLILFNILDSCDYYYATDFSKDAINHTKEAIRRVGYNDKLSTIVCTADELPYEQLEKNYDTVIINSVIQCFPSLDYLETVITKAISNMGDHGQIFIGDVRDFRLFKCFHCSVQTYKRGKITSFDVDYFSLRDKELLISPKYFIYLKTINEHISHVEILPKLGQANHEMNNYRYDVILHIRKNKENKNEKNKIFWIKESDFFKTLDLESYFFSHIRKDYFCIKYPNKRIAQDYIQYNEICHNESKINIGYPEKLFSMNQISDLAEHKNYGVKFFIDVSDPLYLDIVIFKHSFSSQNNIFIDYNVVDSKTNLANDPLATSKLLENQFSNELKEYLSAKLPRYMVPGRYIALEKLPLTINGKLDKKALVEPEFTRSGDYVAPRNTLERQICQIWSEVLNLPEVKIGIQDEFFNLGGHSLSALRALSLIKRTFLIKLPTQTLFDYPTIKKLAELIQKMRQDSSVEKSYGFMSSPLIMLQKNGFETPLFLIHPIGGTIFWYKTLSTYLGSRRSIYAIQDPGINSHDFLFKDIREIASFYLKTIQDVQPTGPYLIAGASFGATVSIEIAHQLLKMGEKVNFIGLLDGWPVYSKKFWEKEFFENLMLQQFQSTGSQFINPGICDVQFLLKLQRHRMSMLRDYKIPLIKGKLTFFKAVELWPVFKEMFLPPNCWQPYSTQPVDVHLVPGNHETMFWEPHVQSLAMKINLSLEKVDQHCSVDYRYVNNV